MHRTEGANNLAGLFTEGPPATTVTEEWLNAIQEEITNVIESAGMTLKNASNDTRDQLRSALLQTVPMPRGYIDGLIMSNNVIDSDHDIDIAVGKCRDSGDVNSILFTTALTKQIDAAWAEGTNAGGFPTGLGVVAADTWYHVFVIMSADGTKVDIGFDTSLIATNLFADATDYSVYRRIGSVLTDAANNIISFYQQSDLFMWGNPSADIAALALILNVSQLLALPVPLGVKTLVSFNVQLSSLVGNKAVYFSSPYVDDENVVSGSPPGPSIYIPSASGGASLGGQVNDILSNTTSQIRVITDDTSTLANLSVLWYKDFRGKDA